MAEPKSQRGTRDHVAVLKNHGITPLTTAMDVAKRERSEVAVERDAFREFAADVKQLAPGSSAGDEYFIGTSRSNTSDRPTRELRRLYHETVMSIPHYDSVYGDALEESVTAEFGPAIAELFDPGSNTGFSAQQRDILVRATEQLVEDRDALVTQVEAELSSLRSMHREIADLLTTVDDSVMPGWYRETFHDRLESLHVERQGVLNDRSVAVVPEDHSLCTYLYQEEPWTFPGLTAVGRIRNSVTFRNE